MTALRPRGAAPPATSRRWAGQAAGAALLALASAQPVAAQDAGQAQGAGWTFSVQHRLHADALPLRHLGDDDWTRLAPRPGLNLAYLEDEVRLTRGLAGPVPWRLSLLARQSATVVANLDALALAAAADRGDPPTGDRRWQAHARVDGLAGAGLALGARHAVPLHAGGAWHLDWQAQALALGRWQERRISGPVQYDAQAGSYAIALLSERADNRLAYPFQRGFGRHGMGLLLDATLRGQLGPWQIALGVRDGGRLHWQGLPQQTQRIDTDREGIDEAGFIVYRPLIQGVNRQDGRTRTRPWRGLLALDHTLPDGQQWGVRVDTLPGFGALPALQWRSAAADPSQPGAGPSTDERPRWGAEWLVHERRLDLWAQWQGWSLRMGADRLGAGARSRALGLAYTRPLGP